jgi:hypothetical protein
MLAPPLGIEQLLNTHSTVMTRQQEKKVGNGLGLAKMTFFVCFYALNYVFYSLKRVSIRPSFMVKVGLKRSG